MDTSILFLASAIKFIVPTQDAINDPLKMLRNHIFIPAKIFSYLFLVLL